MRLWTVHPQYLDVKGLTALWREGLLARAVLRGKTRGYTNHPQLFRFKEHPNPLAAIDVYLKAVLEESRRRGYRYDGSKIDEQTQAAVIKENRGQLQYEWQHLLNKLKIRDLKRWGTYTNIDQPKAHPLFIIVEGGVQGWEKMK